MKRFRDAVAENPELKDDPELDSLRKTLLKEPLAFFRSLRDRLQADGDTRPESLVRLAVASARVGPPGRRDRRPGRRTEGARDALAIWERLVRDDPTQHDYQLGLAQIQNSRGNLLSDTGQPAEAQASFESALAIMRRWPRSTPPSPSTSANWREATAASATCFPPPAGRPAEARASYEAALAILRRLAEAHPNVTDYQSNLAGSHINLGGLLAATGQPAEARAAHEAALAIQRSLAEAHPAVTEYQSTWREATSTSASCSPRPATRPRRGRRTRRRWRSSGGWPRPNPTSPIPARPGEKPQQFLGNLLRR